MFVFLMCSERSGSNFLTNLAGGFPSISAPPPTHLFRLFANARSGYGDLEAEANWRILISDVVENLEAKLGTWRTSVDEAELHRDARCRHPFELLRIAYEKEAQADGAQHSFIKENQTYAFVDALLDFYHDCRFVMMVRDPRDVASSWVRTDSIPGGVRKAVDTWHRDQAGALPVYLSLAEAGRALLLRYEDLLAEPGRKLGELAEFLNIPFDPAVFDFYKDDRTRANAARIKAWENTGRPIMRDNAGGYRKTLTAADVRYIELRCAALMDRFGYPLETIVAGERNDGEEMARLEPQLSAGRHVIDNGAEAEIRQRRLEALERVLGRDLA